MLPDFATGNRCTVFVTADLHFGDNALCGQRKRPFAFSRQAVLAALESIQRHARCGAGAVALNTLRRASGLQMAPERGSV